MNNVITEHGQRIRIDLPRGENIGHGPQRGIDRILYDCPDCNRVHLVALECPPANAKIKSFYHNKKEYSRVEEEV